ncbi:hypothetical protein MRX96_034527 [Rhipicephalus microplus]
MWWGSERGLPPDAHQWCGKAAGAPREPLKSVGTAGALPTIGGSSLGASELHKTARARNPAFSRVGGQCLRGACCAAESCRCLFDSGDENSASMMPVVRDTGSGDRSGVGRERSRSPLAHGEEPSPCVLRLEPRPFEGVLPVYLSACDSGTVRWNHVRGALRIVLQAQREFQACFRVSADSSGALVYVAPRGNLLPGPGLRAKCVLSNRASVVVYAVATAAARAGSRLSLTYTTSQQPVASYERLQGWEVAEATVRNATYHSDEQSIYWWLSVTKTHRGRKPDYVTRPARCGFPRDTREPRLILARWHLGHPVVTCAPKLSQWKKLWVQEKVGCNPEMRRLLT